MTMTKHWKIVTDSLSGRRVVDEQTQASLAVLNEKLDNVRKLGPVFEKVEFSSAVRKLVETRQAVAIC